MNGDITMTINFSRVAKPPPRFTGMQRQQKTQRQTQHLCDSAAATTTSGRTRPVSAGKLAETVQSVKALPNQHLSIKPFPSAEMPKSRLLNWARTTASEQTDTDTNLDVYSNYFQRKSSKRESKTFFLDMPLATYV